ncbi:MAG: NAD(P)/FAD-dependent oxidoreductase [Polyangiales bacterium]
MAKTRSNPVASSPPTTPEGRLPSTADAVIVGSGHNALVCALLLARSGLKVVVLEASSILGGATRTERPFKKVPQLGCSTASYLLGVMPPELLRTLGIDLPLRKRDTHYFLPTLDQRYLLIGSNQTDLQRQFVQFFSAKDWDAHTAMQNELAHLREDLAPAWLLPPLSVEATADRFIRESLREIFVDLVRGPISTYLDRFSFQSPLIKAMYATTDAFSGLNGGYDSPGTGHNFLVHNMCRLPGGDGAWMIVEGGMGTIARKLEEAARAAGAHIVADAEVASIDVSEGAVRSVTLKRGDVIHTHVVVSGADPFRTNALVSEGQLPSAYLQKIAALRKDGTTLKVNLAFDRLPQFTCLPKELQASAFGPTIHILPQGDNVIDVLRSGFSEVTAGRLAQEVTIEWYFHTPLDPSLRDPKGHHNGALFVQWVPYQLSGGKTWATEESKYVKHLLSVCDRFAPGTSAAVVDVDVMTPQRIEERIGITGGHIHHVDNAFSFDQRAPYELPIEGLFACSAGCHPAGSVVGAAGHNAAKVVLRAMAQGPRTRGKSSAVPSA